MLSSLTHDDPLRVGSYQLVARLGSGGMGTVYLARSAGGRTVALKTMHSRIAADTGLRDRFRLETDAARVIGGQHGAEVVDADPAAEVPWLATAYVLGPPLDAAVRLSGPLPEPTVRVLGSALCGALGQLHRSDVVHRDLKPANIMVTADGPKIIDFGTAHAVGGAHLTETGRAAGTPAFMSPEQAAGQEHTAAGDVFALAGVLVFAATGRNPFGRGQAADLLYRVRYEEPDLSGVPDALAPLLAHALDKDPRQRPTTGELAARLHDGSGEFADQLTPELLTEIGRRASEVWQFTPVRLPAPAEAPPEPVTPAPRKGLSRRGMLLLGGGSVAAAAGVALTAYAKAEGLPFQGEPDPPPGDDGEEWKKDARWHVEIGGNPDELITQVAPFVAGDLIAVVGGKGLKGIDARDGVPTWRSEEHEHTWQIASDGRDLYRMVPPPVSAGQSGGRSESPLRLSTVGPGDGTAGEPFAEIEDVNAGIDMNQMLCAADGVLYVVAGQGRASKEFLDSQSWKMIAVDAGSGKKRWSEPLKSRAQGSDRLIFLSAAVFGDRLVVLREQDNGAVTASARDTRTGAPVWDEPVDVGPKDLERDPLTADGGHLYIGGRKLRALRLSDKHETWSARPVSSGSRFGPPTVKDGVVYAVEKGRGLAAFDAASGKRKWTERGGDGGNAILRDRPVVGSRHVYSASPDGLRAISLSSHTTAATYKTVGTRFLAHDRTGTIIAVGGGFVAGYDLK